MSEALIHFSQARQALQKAKTIDEVIQIRDEAERWRVALRQAKEAPEMVNDAVEIKVRAERRAGEMLKEGAETGDRAVRGQAQIEKSRDVTFKAPTLSEIGVSKMQSSRWQALADIPEETFEETIRESKEKAVTDLSTQALLRVAQEQKREERREERILKVIDPLHTLGRFPLIYADPPWRYDFSVDDADQIENHYPTMSLDEICALPVAAVAADAAILFLWATSPKLAEAMQVIGAWGFSYRTNMVWDKAWPGPGYYARQRHESLLIAVRGDLPTPRPHDRPESIFAERRTEHSKKPKLAYELIERMYPELPKLELFARSAREGWKAWGNDAALACVA